MRDIHNAPEELLLILWVVLDTNTHMCMCKCTTRVITPWPYPTKRSRVWQSPPLWKTIGDLPVFSQTRSHAYPPCVVRYRSHTFSVVPMLVTLAVVRMQSHWPVVNHTLIQMHPNNILTWTYFNCLGKIDCIQILVSDKPVFSIIWVYLDNLTKFAVKNTWYPRVYIDMLPS